MKLTVHHKGQVYIIPCGKGDKNVKWLIDETVKRSQKLNGLEVTNENSTGSHWEARLQQTHGLLMEEDLICDVLDDNALVYIGIIQLFTHIYLITTTTCSF